MSTLKNKITSNNTTVTGDETAGAVTLHNTVIVRWDPKHITLDTGGWKTVTTKARMNEALAAIGSGCRVFQERGALYVSIPAMGSSAAEVKPYYGSVITLPREIRS